MSCIAKSNDEMNVTVMKVKEWKREVTLRDEMCLTVCYMIFSSRLDLAVQGVVMQLNQLLIRVHGMRLEK